MDAICPAAKVRRVDTASCRIPALLRLLGAGALVDILQTVRASVPASSEGVRAYTDFSGLLRLGIVPRIPPRISNGVRFSLQGVLVLYTSHSHNEFPLLCMGKIWRTAEATTAARGLANTPPRRHLFAIILNLADCMRFMRRDSFNSELGRLGFAPYVFALRLQSDALPMHMASPSTRRSHPRHQPGDIY